jgi:hypothetical protein
LSRIAFTEEEDQQLTEDGDSGGDRQHEKIVEMIINHFKWLIPQSLTHRHEE